MTTRTRALGRITRGLLACLLTTLAACGGGDKVTSTPDDGDHGPGTGGGTTGQPTIYSSVLLVAPFGTSPAVASAFVDILNQAGTVRVTDAVVKINNTTMPYVAAESGYVADLDIQPGEAVNLSATIAGVTYTASANMRTRYPTITNPAPGVLWNSSVVHRVEWTSDTPVANSEYLLGMLGRYTAAWPADGLLSLPASARLYDIPAGVLVPDNYLLVVGLSEGHDIAAARPGSQLVLAMINHRELTVQAPPSAPTTRDLFLENVINPLSMGAGSTRQLSLIAIDSDNVRQEASGNATWSSSNPAVLTVSAGKLTALAAGTVVVSATYGGLTVTLNVQVFAPTVPTPTATVLSNSVTFQGDHAHTGYLTVGGSGPTLPLAGKWTVNLHGPVSYPVVADGRVFVTVMGDNLGLYAVDVTSGAVLWGPANLATPTRPYTWSTHAYDQGRVFVLDQDARLRSFDAATGTAGWSLQLPVSNRLIGAAPVAKNGVVYVATGGSLFAVNGATGELLWNAINAGTYGSPAVTNDGVFVAGYKLARLDPLSGGIQWTANETCASGLGYSPVYAAGKVFSRQTKPSSNCQNGPQSLSAIVDAASGAVVGQFNSSLIPAVANGRAFYEDGNRLTAVDHASGSTLWTRDFVQAAPLVIDNVVVTAQNAYTSATIYMLDAATGAQLWSDTVAAGLETPMEYGGAFSSFGAGDGYLLVPAGQTLTGWKMKP